MSAARQCPQLGPHLPLAQDLADIVDHANRRLLHRNVQTHKMRHRRRSFSDARGQADPRSIIVCEGAARSSLEGSGAAAAIHQLSTVSVSKGAVTQHELGATTMEI